MGASFPKKSDALTEAGSLTQTVHASVSDDTQIFEDVPNKNYGAATTLHVDGDKPKGSSKDVYGLLHFTLSSIPNDAKVSSVSLKLNVTNATTKAYQLYALKKAWVPMQATWNAWKTGATWEIAGAKGTIDRDSTVLASLAPAAKGTYTANLNASGVAKVQGWVDGSVANNGLILANPTNTDGFNFSASSAKLIVNYEVLDTTPPETTIADGTAEGATLASAEAFFSFSSGEANSTFSCSLDGGAFTACTSPKGYTGLPDGSHTFSVKATDAAGNTDPTPAVRNFVVSVPTPTPLERFEPPAGQVYAGMSSTMVSGDVNDAVAKWISYVNTMGGKAPAISHTFTGWNVQWSFDLSVADARGATPMISWQSGDTLPPAIANAGVSTSGKRNDEIILRNAKILRDYGKPVFLRIDHENNAHWFKWSAYNQDGSPRSFTTDDYKQMWQRIFILFEGGKVSDINAKLSALGMPPLDPNAHPAGLPSTSDPDSVFPAANNVAFVYGPQCVPGTPNIAGNRWADYYPGDKYVDWVGGTTYDRTWDYSIDQKFAFIKQYYDQFSGPNSSGHKPFMFSEYAVTDVLGDDPAYMQRLLDFQATHPKVKALIYFNHLAPDGRDYRLESFPQSAAKLRNAVADTTRFPLVVR